jgi:type IV secretion system protein VirB11
MIVFISGRGTARRVETIARVTGLDPDGNYAVTDLPLDPSDQGV